MSFLQSITDSLTNIVGLSITLRSQLYNYLYLSVCPSICLSTMLWDYRFFQICRQFIFIPLFFFLGPGGKLFALGSVKILTLMILKRLWTLFCCVSSFLSIRNNRLSIYLSIHYLSSYNDFLAYLWLQDKLLA